MQQRLNVTLASRDFRLPISPEYANASKTGFEYIRDHLGYRLELRSAMLPQQAVITDSTAAVAFTFQAALINWGFAAPVSPRPVQLVLLAQNGTIVWCSASIADPRDWQPFTPGDPTFLPLLHRLQTQATIPASALRCAGAGGADGGQSGGIPHAQSCAFHFGLHLPDMRMERAAQEGPDGGAAYCIRFANDGMPWSAGGVNVLGIFTVNHAAQQEQ